MTTGNAEMMKVAHTAGELCTQAPIKHFRALHKSSANFYNKCVGVGGERHI